MTRLPQPPTERSTSSDKQLRADANSYLGAGVGLGAFSVASGALLGAVCPLCIVATPALIAAGIYKHVCARRGTGDKPRPSLARRPVPRA